jgi:dTDP-4-dehydrorhamnose 3,5-epimerase
MMKKIETPLQDLYILEPAVFADERGYFVETYNTKTLKSLELNYTFVQQNQSKSSFGTVRGLHFQKGEAAQAKLVRVVQGSVIDAVVDLRPQSPSFGKSFSVELSDSNHLQLLIPRGFAHGFSVISDTAVFVYQCDNFYNKESEGGLNPFDPELHIDWRISQSEAVLSQKDKEYPNFNKLDCTQLWI